MVDFGPGLGRRGDCRGYCNGVGDGMRGKNRAIYAGGGGGAGFQVPTVADAYAASAIKFETKTVTRFLPPFFDS